MRIGSRQARGVYYFCTGMPKARARPKSASLSSPSRLINKFCGFRSLYASWDAKVCDITTAKSQIGLVWPIWSPHLCSTRCWWQKPTPLMSWNINDCVSIHTARCPGKQRQKSTDGSQVWKRRCISRVDRFGCEWTCMTFGGSPLSHWSKYCPRSWSRYSNTSVNFFSVWTTSYNLFGGD